MLPAVHHSCVGTHGCWRVWAPSVKEHQSRPENQQNGGSQSRPGQCRKVPERQTVHLAKNLRGCLLSLPPSFTFLSDFGPQRSFVGNHGHQSSPSSPPIQQQRREGRQRPAGPSCAVHSTGQVDRASTCVSLIAPRGRAGIIRPVFPGGHVFRDASQSLHYASVLLVPSGLYNQVTGRLSPFSAQTQEIKC